MDWHKFWIQILFIDIFAMDFNKTQIDGVNNFWYIRLVYRFEKNTGVG